jgi:hypothetical protein
MEACCSGKGEGKGFTGHHYCGVFGLCSYANESILSGLWKQRLGADQETQEKGESLKHVCRD